MTPADVQRLAQRWLGDGTRVTLRYRDESLRPAGYRGDSPPDLSAMGPKVPPASAAPVTIASDADREARPQPGPTVPSQPPQLADQRLDRKSTRLNSSH